MSEKSELFTSEIKKTYTILQMVEVMKEYITYSLDNIKDISNFETELENLKFEVASDYATLETKINNLSTNTQILVNNNVDNLQAQINNGIATIKSSIESLNKDMLTRIDGNTESIVVINKNLELIDTNITELQNDTSFNLAKATTNEENINSLTKRVESIESNASKKYKHQGFISFVLSTNTKISVPYSIINNDETDYTFDTTEYVILNKYKIGNVLDNFPSSGLSYDFVKQIETYQNSSITNIKNAVFFYISNCTNGMYTDNGLYSNIYVCLYKNELYFFTFDVETHEIRTIHYIALDDTTNEGLGVVNRVVINDTITEL